MKQVTVTMPYEFWRGLREVMAKYSGPWEVGHLMLNTWDEAERARVADDAKRAEADELTRQAEIHKPGEADA
jgi:hypothetical protein